MHKRVPPTELVRKPCNFQTKLNLSNIRGPCLWLHSSDPVLNIPSLPYGWTLNHDWFHLYLLRLQSQSRHNLVSMASMTRQPGKKNLWIVELQLNQQDLNVSSLIIYGSLDVLLCNRWIYGHSIVSSCTGWTATPGDSWHPWNTFMSKSKSVKSFPSGFLIF